MEQASLKENAQKEDEAGKNWEILFHISTCDTSVSTSDVKS